MVVQAYLVALGQSWHEHGKRAKRRVVHDVCTHTARFWYVYRVFGMRESLAVGGVDVGPMFIFWVMSVCWEVVARQDYEKI